MMVPDNIFSVQGVIQGHVENFIISNGFRCRTMFDQSTYENIDDDEDRKFYLRNSCQPNIRVIPVTGNEMKIEFFCSSYKWTSGFFCCNPYSELNMIMKNRISGINFTFTDDHLIDLFRPIEDEERIRNERVD